MSGTIDASIPLQARAPAPTNPLQTIGEFANVQNALNQNKLFPGALALQGQQVQSGQSNLIQQQRQLAAGGMARLLAKPGYINHDDLTTAAGGLENSGVVTQPFLADLAKIPVTGDPKTDDASFRAFIAANAQTPANAAGAVAQGSGPTLDVGPTIQPTTVAPPGMPGSGVITPTGPTYAKGIGPQFVQTGAGVVPTNNGAPTGANPIANQLSPSQLATPVQIGIDPKGAPIMGTLGQFLEKAGAAPSPLGTGRLPPALLNPNRPQPASPVGVVTGQGPAQQAQQTAQGATSGHAFQDIADQGVQARTQSALLGNMLGDTASFAPGPEKINEFKATLQRYTPSIAAAFGIKPDSVSANESFDKLASQIASAVGDRSDASLAIAKKANPGSYLSPAGVDLILRSLQGFSDYNQARSQVAASYPDQTDRAAFEKNVGSKLDPRAFQFARMTPAQKIQYASTLSDDDRKAVQKSYNYATQSGLIGGQ